MDHVVSITCAYIGGLVWFDFGPQYVFFAAALISVLNVVVAIMIKPAAIPAK
jgi:predicted MFS family arabinose efflux permease